MQVDARVQEVLGELRSLYASVESGEPIEVHVSEQLMDVVQRLVPLVPRADVKVLQAEVDSLIDMVVEKQRAVSSDSAFAKRPERFGLGTITSEVSIQSSV